MKFTETSLAGAFVVDLTPFEYDRGGFARALCADEFAAHGLEPVVVHLNTSWNVETGTLRGLHYQVDPPEAKFLRCIAGAVFGVMVDLREESPSFLDWFGIELSADSRRAVYLPPMFAYAYLALTDGATVIYSTSSPYTPGAERGLRWDDPAIGIDWPVPVTAVSTKDAAWPMLEGAVVPA